MAITACKKKLYQCRPHAESQIQVKVRVSRKHNKVVSGDPKSIQRRVRQILADKVPYEIKRGDTGAYWQFVQRSGERPNEWSFKGFLSTSDRDEVNALTNDFPKRWHVEEFFNANQSLGWKRAGTMNLNIRYGQMTMALIAQAAIHGLRHRLGDPYCHWDANHLAKDLFFRLEGDVRVITN